ncbi:MAG: hypothetical protein ACXABD_17000, partial [Candidatus Thorarchaeota archaeon]
MKWSIDKLRYIFPNRPFGKTHKENRNARLVDVNAVISDINEVLVEIEAEIPEQTKESIYIVTGGNGTGSPDPLTKILLSGDDVWDFNLVQSGAYKSVECAYTGTGTVIENSGKTSLSPYGESLTHNESFSGLVAFTQSAEMMTAGSEGGGTTILNIYGLADGGGTLIE